MNPIRLKPSTKIESILSNRSINVLKKVNRLINDSRYKIKTIKDISRFSELEILSLKGSGTISAKEMLDVIERSGMNPSVRSNRLTHISWRHIFLSKPRTIKKHLKSVIAI